MKFKEFLRWCSDRVADGCWGMTEAICCTIVVQNVLDQKPWRREKFWKENYRDSVVSKIVYPINKKIEEFRMMQDG